MKLNRWFYAAVGVAVLLFAGLIYAWSVLSSPLAAYFTEWTSAQLSLTFTICMMFFCLGGLLAGILSEKISVKVNMMVSAVLFLVGFTIAARAKSLAGLYLGYGVLAGTASGFAYNSVMGSVTKFFPDKPGLISGILLMGFGLGSFLIGKVYQAYTGPGEGFRTSFGIFGVLLFVIMFLCGMVMRRPGDDEVKGVKSPGTEAKGKEAEKPGLKEYRPMEMIKRSSFWLYFIWAVLLSAAGLAVISQASAMALEVSPLAAPGTVSTVVGMISIFNGIGRVIFGGLFDRIGREKTMTANEILFLLSIALLLVSMKIGSFPVLAAGFVAVGLAYGGVTPTNSAFISSFYGRKNYSVNFPLINMNLLVASFGSTIAGLLYDASGSYFTTLVFMMAAVVAGSVIAVMIRRP